MTEPGLAAIGCIAYRERRLMARAISWVTRSPYTHTVTHLGGGMVGEACGSGYQISPLTNYLPEVADILWVEPPAETTMQQRRTAVDLATALAKTNLRYGWADVAALGLARFGVKPGPVMARLRSPRTAFCSQACAEVWGWAGIECVDKPYYEVTPADLAALAGH